MKTTPTYKQFMLDIKACKNDYQRLQVVKEYVDYYDKLNKKEQNYAKIRENCTLRMGRKKRE